MNKKAVTEDILTYIVYRLPIMIFIAAFLLLVLTQHYTTGLDSHEAESTIMLKRIVYSPNILAYEDPETGRVYPGTIDLSKFETGRLDSGLINKNSKIAANMELENLATGEKLRAYINEQRAKAWDDYVPLGGYDSSYSVRYVKIHDRGSTYPGILKVKVLAKQ